MISVRIFWYGDGERSPLYNRPCMNRGYAIFAANGSDRSYTTAVDSLAPPARLELTTLRLGGVRSIQVSYGGMCVVYCSQNRRFCQLDFLSAIILYLGLYILKILRYNVNNYAKNQK